MGLLSGKNALVTGGGRGIGKAVAISLAQNGANVCVVSRNQPELDAVVADMQSDNVQGLALSADLGTEVGVRDAVAKYFAKFDRCDILVNNAGMAHFTTVAEWPVTEVKKLFDLNILGTYLVTKEISTRMQKQGSGKIIMVSSVMGTQFYAPKHVAYCTSKAAIAAMGKSLQAEIGKAFQINVVIPGLIDTKMTRDLQTQGYPFGSEALTPTDIAPVFVFLASALSDKYWGLSINLPVVWTLLDKVRAEIAGSGVTEVKELLKIMKAKLGPELYDTFKSCKELVDFLLKIKK